MNIRMKVFGGIAAFALYIPTAMSSEWYANALMMAMENAITNYCTLINAQCQYEQYDWNHGNYASDVITIGNSSCEDWSGGCPEKADMLDTATRLRDFASDKKTYWYMVWGG